MSEQVEGRLLETAYQSNLNRIRKVSSGEISEEDLARELAREEVEGLKDPLTGLLNRRAFDQQLVFQVAGAERKKEPLSILMVDLDDLKGINDSHGHQAGDRVLIELGKIIREVVRRRSDIAARYGGEEIAILLPDTRQDGAKKLAEELLDTIRETKVDIGEEKIGFTASVGVAGFKKGMSPEKLVGNADKAVYRAKENGKNRIEVYG